MPRDSSDSDSSSSISSTTRSSTTRSSTTDYQQSKKKLSSTPSKINSGDSEVSSLDVNEDESMSKEKYFADEHVRLIDKIAMFLIGIINNTPYVIGIASAQRIVAAYNSPTYLGIVLWANTVSGIFSRFIFNWVISMNISYEINFMANIIMMLFGLLACAFSKWFWFTCVGIFFIGFSSYIGESVILCYMTYRRKHSLLKSWGSGTGFAGIAGAGYSFICDIVNISIFWSFIGVAPVAIIYALIFFFIIKRSPESDVVDFKKGQKEDEERKKENDEDVESIEVSDEEEVVKEPTFSISYFNNGMWWIMFNCGAVYFLEYVMQGVLADCSLDAETFKKYHYMFSLLNLMYQIGVFISRSSLSFFEVRRIWIMTLAQCFFFVLYFFNAFYHFMPPGALWGTMVVVGLFGGCSYVNAFNLMMKDPTKTTKQKEMITSWNAFFIAVFIVLSTLFTFIAERTFLVPPSY
ncbi:CLN3 protein [Tritrichomonas foetus]|uniref:CLN3 protein n=1 Tax=Tritrichomonas foetus TaxID=1144522 RepID=A0A1J4J7H7_9EUKA|nr:CLN3 protein [Tritrichomonas foetus]|eukprot:OHS93397.1 CLN3 protein [Tritrichomonas foetus]